MILLADYDFINFSFFLRTSFFSGMLCLLFLIKIEMCTFECRPFVCCGYFDSPKIDFHVSNWQCSVVGISFLPVSWSLHLFDILDLSCVL